MVIALAVTVSTPAQGEIDELKLESNWLRIMTESGTAVRENLEEFDSPSASGSTGTAEGGKAP